MFCRPDYARRGDGKPRLRISNNARKSFSIEPAQEQAEVEAGGCEHGIDPVAISAFEIVATHPMIVLEMADHGLDGGATAHLATDGFGDPADQGIRFSAICAPSRFQQPRPRSGH
jgi:hypothetical protein